MFTHPLFLFIYMSFKNVEIKKLPNKQDILDNITDRDIFEYYLGAIPQKPIKSPLRNDNIPSFSIFYSDKYEKLMFKDFATGDVGDAFVFVMRLLGIARITDVFCVIADHFNLTQFETTRFNIPSRKSYVSKGNILRKAKSKLNIAVKVRDWNIEDEKYWYGKYRFTKEMLKYCGIYPISHYFIGNICRVTDRLAYAFLEEKDNAQTFKIYQPFSKEHKWINNNDYSTWELWSQLPETGENLIITSSRKDAMAIKSCFDSSFITSCSLQSENTNPKEHIIDELKSRFKNIYVLYDNDFSKERNAGREAGKKMCDKFGLKQIEIDSTYKTKDPSDFLEKNGKPELKKLLKTLILTQ